MAEITQVLDAVGCGEAKAEELLPLVYNELRRVAAARLAQERPGQTLQATALVHEAWLRVTSGAQPQWRDHRHFFRIAAETMRRILVGKARRESASSMVENGSAWTSNAVELPSPMPDDELLALNDALDKLVQVNSRAAELVKLCFFTGLTQEQAARELGISVATAERTWTFARAWLFREIERQNQGGA